MVSIESVIFNERHLSIEVHPKKFEKGIIYAPSADTEHAVQ